ncbi:MAG TPA: CpsD/CapB family tyrosine-protein kinase [Chloroflexia bacterium]|nr:CpsD/CapB family tyrosine-protein kinase [Chloroflexia bacterium]
MENTNNGTQMQEKSTTLAQKAFANAMNENNDEQVRSLTTTGEAQNEDSDSTVDMIRAQESRELKTISDRKNPAIPDFENATLNERFHRVFRRLNVNPTLEEPLILGITSSVRGEGRTLTALGMAVSISQQIPLPVLLLEADISEPTLATDLNLPNQGLCEYLRGEMELDDLVHSTALPDMGVILAGDAQGEPLRVLRSERLNNLLTMLSQQFAAIVIDLPPLSATAESTRLISQIDKVLLVVEAGNTPAKIVKSAMEYIPEDKRAGVVLNRTRKPTGPFRWMANFFSKDK